MYFPNIETGCTHEYIENCKKCVMVKVEEQLKSNSRAGILILICICIFICVYFPNIVMCDGQSGGAVEE